MTAAGREDGGVSVGHTPGPWHVAHSIIYGPFKGGSAERIADVSTWADNYAANAALIAAAPDLLAALEALIETCPCDPDATARFMIANADAVDAIRRARGQPNDAPSTEQRQS